MRKLVSIIAITVITMLMLVACSPDEGDKLDQNRQEAVESREGNFTKAEQAHPAPTGLSNFPIREALVKFTERQDLINHPWYVYIMGMNGDPVGYYISETYPINACNFLSDTTRFVELDSYHAGSWGTTQAPSYDGVYYGNDACNKYFFFDVTTDAMHTFVAPMFLASDRPYTIYGDVPLLSVEGGPVETPVPTPTPEAIATP